MYSSTPAAIGSPCTADDRCNTFIPNGVCRDGACACADGYVAHPTSTTSCLPGEDIFVHSLVGGVKFLNPKLTPLH